MPSAVVDVQCFVDSSDNFIIKEMTIVDVETLSYQHWIYKPPVTSQLDLKSTRTNQWLSHNYHKLNWKDGYTNYEEIANILDFFGKKYDFIYVKGLQKQLLLKSYLRNKLIINVELLGCPKISDLTNSVPGSWCLYHNGINENMCTVYRGVSIAEWIKYYLTETIFV